MLFLIIKNTVLFLLILLRSFFRIYSSYGLFFLTLIWFWKKLEANVLIRSLDIRCKIGYVFNHTFTLCIFSFLLENSLFSCYFCFNSGFTIERMFAFPSIIPTNNSSIDPKSLEWNIQCHLFISTTYASPIKRVTFKSGLSFYFYRSLERIKSLECKIRTLSII